MRIDWWTLALQTANVLILIWLLARFLFRPVAEIVARRQHEVNRLLAHAAGLDRKADETRADLERVRGNIATERDKVIVDAHTAAEAERALLLARVNEEIRKLRADAESAIARDRTEMEQTLIDRARQLTIEIARRLLGRVPSSIAFDVFVTGLSQRVQALSGRERAAFATAAGESGSIEVVTATPLGADEKEGVRRAISAALGDEPTLVFRTDPDVIAGIELRSRHAILCNSWRNDLERIHEEMGRVDETAKQSR